jgi:hypothetical protein
MRRARLARASASSKTVRLATMLVAAALARVPAALAQVPEPETRREVRRVVVLDVAGAEGVDAEFEATLGELLGRLHLDLARPGRAADARVVAVVRVEPSERGALLTVHANGSDVPPVHREVDRGDSPALFRETLAHVILGAIEPLAARHDERDRAPDVEPPAATVTAVRENPRATSVPPVGDTTRDPMRLSIGANAGPRLLESDRAGIAFAGVVSLTLPIALRPSAAVEAGYVLPVRASRNSVDAEIHVVPLRLDARVQPIAGRIVALETGVVGGVDVISLDPQSVQTFIRLQSSSSRLQPVFGGAVAARFRLSPTAEFVLTAGGEVDIAPRRWVVVVGSQHDAIFETARFRPFASLGLDLAMLGATAPPALQGAP